MINLKNNNLSYKEKIYKDYNYIGSNKNGYFEGWYFKHNYKDMNFSVIPGVSICNNKKICFIQIIENVTNNSWFFEYDISKFKYTVKPFSITIDKNFFSLEKIDLNINSNNVCIKANLEYKGLKYINKSKYSPNIMGPFAYIPFLECRHSVISMFHEVIGSLKINEKSVCFESGGIGYIEKDYGTSFPSKYIWTQCSSKLDNNYFSMFIAIANIPIGKLSFIGHICNLNISGKEFRFATYNGSKIKRYNVNKNDIDIILKKGIYTLKILSSSDDGKALKSPKCGNMKNIIYESLNATCEIKLYKYTKCIFTQNISSATSEIFKG